MEGATTLVVTAVNHSETTMRFQGSGRPLTADGFYSALGRLRIGESELWAVLNVESAGFGFLADRRPRLRFDAHVFHDLTDRAWSQGFPEISTSFRADRRSDAGEYDRLMTALVFDQEAALASASWGLGQIVGYRLHEMGYKGLHRMAAEMVAGEDAQLLAVVRCIENTGAGLFLRHHDWQRFALRYRGKCAAGTGYAKRLAAAYRCAERTVPDLAVRTAQAALLYLGIDPGPVDGIASDRTRAALREYQRFPRAVRGLFIGADLVLQRTA